MGFTNKPDSAKYWDFSFMKFQPSKMTLGVNSNNFMQTFDGKSYLDLV